MKKVVYALFALISLGLSGMVSAQGLHYTGNVTVNGTVMYGSMSNLYNTAATTYTTFIYANGYANSSISFGGRDGEGDSFSCYVPTTSALYSQAVDVRNNMRNGSYINVSKSSTSNECTSVYMLNASMWMD